jgi:hypothetical protein
MRTQALIVGLALAGVACQPGPPADITPASLLNSLRVLAIKAEPPDVLPGQTTTLTALVYNPEYDDTQLHFLWIMCDPDLTSAVGSACASFDLARNPSGLFGSIFSQNAGIHVNPFSRESAPYTAPADVFGSLDTTDPLRLKGVPADILLIVYVGDFNALNDPNSVNVFALKTLRIAEESADRNSNPTIDTVRLNGQLLTDQVAGDITPGATLSLSAEPSADSLQTFTRTLPDGTTEKKDEQLVFSWFTTAGKFDAALDVAARTKGDTPIKLAVPKPLNPGVLETYVILRDARGGMDWARRVLKVP